MTQGLMSWFYCEQNGQLQPINQSKNLTRAKFKCDLFHILQTVFSNAHIMTPSTNRTCSLKTDWK